MNRVFISFPCTSMLLGGVIKINEMPIDVYVSVDQIIAFHEVKDGTRIVTTEGDYTSSQSVHDFKSALKMVEKMR